VIVIEEIRRLFQTGPVSFFSETFIFIVDELFCKLKKQKNPKGNPMKDTVFTRDITLRGRGMKKGRLKKIKKGLLTLHRFEIMAVNIYRYQISRKKSGLETDLIAAMKNEMGHVQDFQVKLLEYGWRPHMLRWQNWMIGWVFGWSSAMMGRKDVLRMGIWTETRAIEHYQKLLNEVDWDEDTYKMVEKDLNDEVNHLYHWKALLD